MNMKRLFISLATITISSFLFVSCYYDNEEALYPALSNSCDTTNVTYSRTIVPILNDNCLGCHSTVATGGAILLTSYPEVIGYAPRITGSIKQLPSFTAMPKNSGKIKNCSIIQWDIWVKNGMPNN